jgi:hypothetical protein
VNLTRDSSAPSDHLFKRLWNILCNSLPACLIFLHLMIPLTASAGYLTRSNTNILAATGWRWIGTATTTFLRSSPSCGGIASSAPDSPTTSPRIRRWPKPSCTLIIRAIASRNGFFRCYTRRRRYCWRKYTTIDSDMIRLQCASVTGADRPGRY